MKGFVKIPRRFFDTKWWNQRRVFSESDAIIDLYQSAGSKNIMTTSRRTLADRWLWDDKMVHRFLSRLEKEGYISVTKSTSGTVVKIIDFGTSAPLSRAYKNDNIKSCLLGDIDNIDSYESLSTNVDSESSTHTCEEIVNFYNDTVKGTMVAKCVKLTESRKKAIKARLREYGYEGVCNAITIVANSDFCNGKNNRNWTADFDFTFNANKMARILEKKYDGTYQRSNYTAEGGARQGTSDSPSDSQLVSDTAAAIAAMAAERRNRQAKVR